MNFIQELRQDSNVYMKDADATISKVQKILCDGFDHLQVISDFDRTLTHGSFNNKPCASCHGVLESGELLNPEIREKLKQLSLHYYPIEMDPDLPVEEKIPVLTKWWDENHALLEQCGIDKLGISQAVKASSALLRDGCNEFFATLDEYGVPLLIFSAGIADVLEEIIRQQSKIYPNMIIVSNSMKFNDKGTMIGMKGSTIHIFNKNKKALDNMNYAKCSEKRENVLLLGDSMGDLQMSDGVENMKTCLKIGFLNGNVEQWLDKYINAWDIVLVGEPSLSIVNKLILDIKKA